MTEGPSQPFNACPTPWLTPLIEARKNAKQATYSALAALNILDEEPGMSARRRLAISIVEGEARRAQRAAKGPRYSDAEAFRNGARLWLAAALRGGVTVFTGGKDHD